MKYSNFVLLENTTAGFKISAFKENLRLHTFELQSKVKATESLENTFMNRASEHNNQLIVEILESIINVSL